MLPPSWLILAAMEEDPKPVVAFERLQGLETDGELPLAQYFSSHPPLAQRIERLRGLIRVRRS